MSIEFNNETLNVVDYYNDHLIQLNEKIINDTFNEKILKQSNIDINANKETANQIYDIDKKIAKDTKDRNIARGFMIFMWIIGPILIAVGITLLVINMNKFNSSWKMVTWIILIVIGVIIFGCSWLVRKKYKKEQSNIDEFLKQREAPYKLALNQLSDIKSKLNTLLTYEIFETTYPLVKFNKCFSEENYLLWTKWLQNDVNSTCLYCLSGTLNTNPFIILKTKKTEMYDHVYTGTKMVMVQRTRTIDGKTQSYMAPKVVVATTTNPAPRYWNETKLFYINNAADDLNFENIIKFDTNKSTKKAFRKDKEMQPMENSEFDKLFPTYRDNEISFRTLFSILAQEQMCKLLKFKKDYKFIKHERLNIISSPSFESFNWYLNTSDIEKAFDYEVIKNDFHDFNKSFFTNVYFMFAPLLTVPLYQQYRFRETISDKGQIRLLSWVQHEHIVNNSYNQTIFAHAESRTDNILKTKRVFENSLYEINEIIAYSYKAKTRITIVPVMDFEAGLVNVPVSVIDYTPVQKSTYVTNAYVEKLNSDFELNNNSQQTKTLNVNKIIKKEYFISMLMKNKEQRVEVDKYKEFLNQLKVN